MVTVSLAMIVKNEEKILGRCLDCVKNIVDEIIVVDTGSSDNTLEIARRYTDKVFNFDWIDDFSAARNFSFEKSTKDFILWLDADDIITAKNQRRLIALKEELNIQTDFVMMKYAIEFDNSGNITFSYYRERLIKNNKLFLWNDPVHETITPSGRIIYSDIIIEHRKISKSGTSKRNLNIYRRMLDEKKELSPRQLFYYARELMFNNYFHKAIKVFLKFLNDDKGWKENSIEACKNLAECFRKINKNDENYSALFRSFRYDSPRAEICCDIGQSFINDKMYEKAAFWYKLALDIKPAPESGAFCLLDCYGYIPNIQLCFIYDRLNDKKTAKIYNEIAASYKPYSNAVLYNRSYFNNIGI